MEKIALLLTLIFSFQVVYAADNKTGENPKYFSDCDLGFLGTEAYESVNLDSKSAFQFHFEKIVKFKNSNQSLPPDSFINAVLDSNIRSSFVQLYALAKLHENLHLEKFKFIKKISNDYGVLIQKVRFHTELLENTKTKLKNRELVALFEAELEEAKQELITLFNKYLIYANEGQEDEISLGLNSMIGVAELGFFNFHNWKGPYASNREYVLAELTRYTRDLQDDIDKAKYDPANIENGLFKLREDIHWALIMVQAMPYQVRPRYDDKLNRFATSWSINNKTIGPIGNLQGRFIQLETNPTGQYVNFPMNHSALMTAVVLEISKIQRIAQQQIYVRKTLKRLNYNDDYIMRAVAALNDGQVEIEHAKTLRQYLEKLKTSRLLIGYAQYMEKQAHLNLN